MGDHQYIAYYIRSTDEILLALLSMYNFDSFQEEDHYTIGYISREHNAAEEENILKLLQESKVEYDVKPVENKNWNEEWEKSFKPVKVGNFCSVRADFHPRQEGVQYDIIINPKLAFGTGHHETTYMMIAAMKELPIKGSRVLDYGCGTGILAILAGMMHATYIKAIDIEEESYLNTIESAKINGISNIDAVHGTLEDLECDEAYDIILANINRNVLYNNAQALTKLMYQSSSLLMSGILLEDEEMIKNRYRSLGMLLLQEWTRGEWMCLHFIWPNE